MNYNGSYEEGGLFARISNGTYMLVAGGKMERRGLPKNEEVAAAPESQGRSLVSQEFCSNLFKCLIHINDETY